MHMAGAAKGGRAAVKGATKVFPIGKLLRPAGGLSKGADEAAGKIGREAAEKTGKRTRKISQEEAWKRAREARDDMHRKLAADARRGPDGNPLSNSKTKERMRHRNAVTGCTDPNTGLSAGGHNVAADGSWGCAEKNALDNLNAKRRAADPNARDLEPHEVDFCEANKPSHNGPPSDNKPICRDWCQERTDPEQYPNDTPYEGSTPDDADPYVKSRWDELEEGRK
jgi:hypothetical protein